ncbi:MAG TPA: glutamate synthase subunit beta [Acidimicrobiales bacterium]|nr:glutamate synthase subunit beta [Acidimicrobiales bacterium]
MPDPRGFLEVGRAGPRRRPVEERVRDWREVDVPFGRREAGEQATRCMDCGIPFCSNGCPLGNAIPDWNDLVRTGRWEDAARSLHATDNFPDFTGRICPAPCEAACVLSLGGLDQAVAIRQVELSISERAWEDGLVVPQTPPTSTGRRVAVVGSGPAGLAAAQQLTRAGHAVTVFERSDRAGGLLRYGIPDFKLEKAVIDRRLEQLESEGTRFQYGVDVGGSVSVEVLRGDHDAVVLAVGATEARELTVPGRDLAGVHLAMEYLEGANRLGAGDFPAAPIDAAGKDVVIVGGGDTGADCLGTATRQGAASIRQLQYHPRPPDPQDNETPWPLWPHVLHSCAAYEENGDRLFEESTQEFVGDDGGRLRAVRTGAAEYPAQLALIAIGFTGPKSGGAVSELGLRVSARGTVAVDEGWMSSADGVFACGDATRGQSLVVWAIADGRACAAAVNRWLDSRGRGADPVQDRQLIRH